MCFLGRSGAWGGVTHWKNLWSLGVTGYRSWGTCQTLYFSPESGNLEIQHKFPKKKKIAQSCGRVPFRRVFFNWEALLRWLAIQRASPLIQVFAPDIGDGLLFSWRGRGIQPVWICITFTHKCPQRGGDGGGGGAVSFDGFVSSCPTAVGLQREITTSLTLWVLLTLVDLELLLSNPDLVSFFGQLFIFLPVTQRQFDLNLICVAVCPHSTFRDKRISKINTPIEQKNILDSSRLFLGAWMENYLHRLFLCRHEHGYFDYFTFFQPVFFPPVKQKYPEHRRTFDLIFHPSEYASCQVKSIVRQTKRWWYNLEA